MLAHRSESNNKNPLSKNNYKNNDTRRAELVTTVAHYVGIY